MFQDEGRALPRIARELVALVVSGINLSNYCLAAHLEILGRLGFDKKLCRKLALDYESAPVEPKVMALFRFAHKLSRRPADVEKSDVDELRKTRLERRCDPRNNVGSLAIRLRQSLLRRRWFGSRFLRALCRQRTLVQGSSYLESRRWRAA